MTYGDFKDLKRFAIADKAIRDKTFNIAKNPKYDEYQRAFASLFHKSFDKKTLAGTAKSEVICYEELAEELIKPSIRKFEKKDVHSLLWTIFEVKILKDLDFFMLFIFIGNMYRLFLKRYKMNYNY